LRRAAATTSYPSLASRRAVAAPIPLLAPVTTAIRRLLTFLSVGANGFDPFGQD
jgi:hypothetical protein